MNTPVLNDNLRAATEALCNLLAKEDQVVASKAKIGLFFQNPEATKLFEEVNAYGEELRNKHLAGMPPTEEEISKFDTLRENVVKNDAARGFLEARQTIDELLNTINHYLGMSIDLGRAPTPEEIEEARQRAMSAQQSPRKAAIATAIATTTTRTGAAAAATTKSDLSTFRQTASLPGEAVFH